MARALSKRRRKQIAKAAQKAIKKHSRGKNPTSRPLKIQTASPWKRGAIALLGLALCGLAVWLWSDSALGSAVCGGLGVVILIVAFLGNKKTIDGSFNGIDSALTNKALDSIIDGLF